MDVVSSSFSSFRWTQETLVKGHAVSVDRGIEVKRLNLTQWLILGGHKDGVYVFTQSVVFSVGQI